MADNSEVTMKPTLGLTGLTMNAMALIAPGAFLWLTFVAQGTAGATAPSMWAGIFFALLLCLATAVCYAEMEVPITLPNRRFSTMTPRGRMREFPNSSSAGALTCTTGSIPA